MKQLTRYTVAIATVVDEASSEGGYTYVDVTLGDTPWPIWRHCDSGPEESVHIEKMATSSARHHATKSGLREDEFEVEVVRQAYRVVRDSNAEARHVEECKHLMSLLDAFFRRARNHSGSEIKCGAGCSECCSSVFPAEITRVEAAVIREHVATLTEQARLALAATVRAHPWAKEGEPCPALGTDGHCQIYAARPMTCRGWGLIRLRHRKPWEEPDAEDDWKSTCHLNFSGRRVRLKVLSDLPVVGVLDRDEWEGRLLRVENAFAGAAGAPAVRAPISSLSATLQEALGISNDELDRSGVC